MSKTDTNYLAIDYGTKKSWLAYSVGIFAFPWETVPTKGLFENLPKLLAEKKASAIVLGLPYHIDGSISPHGQRVLAFARRIDTELGIDIFLHDERLTSSEATIFFEENRIDGEIDTEAARLILEGFLEMDR